ncbi:HalD/BesD family halogenase [Candidatus Poriferisocius sp.]|uniref:HalD/BesD family halogenase n=1 Tax=Candidatus Poriferisocius sp. TaxID=3101276 RepID=UPI003B02A16D
MNQTSPIELADLVDLEAFPIDDPTSASYIEAVNDARVGLRAEGCAVLNRFVSAEAVELLNDEVLERRHATHYSTQVINPYFHTAFNPDYPVEHPVNTFIERTSGFIPGDAWDRDCATDILFQSSEVARFLADCLEIPILYCYDDPLARLVTNICDPGQQLTWHFDTNEFTVTVLVQPADEGGVFEYAPGIRSADDEGFDAIAHVLAGGRNGVKTLDLQPGDLQIFMGRFSMHRVTRVGASSRPRHTTILAYTPEPGVIGRVERTRQLFGRVLPAHEHAEQERVRSDALLD